jgi:protein involved in polysaccharide export with SLBB domain
MRTIINGKVVPVRVFYPIKKETYLSITQDGTIEPPDLMPVRVVGLNGPQAKKEIEKAIAKASADAGVPSRNFVDIDVYLPAGSAALGTAVEDPQSDHKIGPGDLISITTVDLLGVGRGDFTDVKRISADGTFQDRLLGSIQSSGLRTSELEQTLRQTYRDGKIVFDAKVSVKVLEIGK